jgi:S1/P1 Nuclease
MTRRATVLGVGLLAAGALVGGLAIGWWSGGHETIAEAAAARLLDDVPAFFRRGGKELAHFAVDPDRWKNREMTFLRRAEEGNHFLDTEDLDGKPLPGTHRFDAMKMIYTDLKKEPNKVGLLPYAIMEYYEKLTVGFYDYRKSPNNAAIPMKCLVYGGVLAHYTGDAAMPLHTTRDFDGKNQPDGTVKQKGIHAKIDGFPEKNGIKPEEVCRGLEAKKIDDVWGHVLKFIEESRSHIPKAYELDATGAFDKPTDESRAFILARVRAGAQLTLDLWYNAWLRSEKLPAHW